MPKNGDEWHAIRQGHLPYSGRYSIELHNLLEQMIHPDPALRPTTQALTQHPVLGPNGAKSKDQLSRELNAERLKNRQLSEKLLGKTKASTDTKLQRLYYFFFLPKITEASRQLENLMPMRFSVGDNLDQVPAPKVPKLHINESCLNSKRLLLGRKMNRSLSNSGF